MSREAEAVGFREVTELTDAERADPWGMRKLRSRLQQLSRMHEFTASAVSFRNQRTLDSG